MSRSIVHFIDFRVDPRSKSDRVFKVKAIKNSKIKEAVNYIIFRHPFYASMLLQQNIVEDNSCDTFYVDGANLGYNTDFANTLCLEENVGVLVHEVYHLILLHHTRMNRRKHELWNQAADYAINIQLVRSGFKLPKGVLLDYQYDNMSAEEIYRLLDKKENDQKKKPSNGNKEEEGDDKQKGAGKKANGIGEVRQASNTKEAEEKAKVQTKQAVAIAKQSGQMPSEQLINIIGATQVSKQDWHSILNRFINDVAAKDYSFEHPDTRFLGSNIILPDLHSKAIGNIVFAIDTSGSVSTKEVEDMVNEVRSCLDIMMEDKDSVELTVIYCDAAVQGVDIFDGSIDKPNPKGGGGTDYAPVFNYIQENDIEPDALIYITDGYCWSFGDIVPDYPVLWAITTGCYTFNAPFGETVNLI